jgi:hypothetical membrane protein
MIDDILLLYIIAGNLLCLVGILLEKDNKDSLFKFICQILFLGFIGCIIARVDPLLKQSCQLQLPVL